MSTLIRLPNRELKRRVAHGASLLDSYRQGWAEKVDLGRLGGVENDVIQQVFGTSRKRSASSEFRAERKASKRRSRDASMSPASAGPPAVSIRPSATWEASEGLPSGNCAGSGVPK
jgi:hypothetical protein